MGHDPDTYTEEDRQIFSALRELQKFPTTKEAVEVTPPSEVDTLRQQAKALVMTIMKDRQDEGSVEDTPKETIESVMDEVEEFLGVELPDVASRLTLRRRTGGRVQVSTV